MADERERREKVGISSLEEVPEEYKDRVLSSGFDLNERERSGSFFQKDRSVLFSLARHHGLEVMSIDDALEKYELEDYYWKAVPADMDGCTRATDRDPTHGVFIRAMANAKISFPIQACLFLAKERSAQRLHNIVIAEENSELHLITGCAVPERMRSAVHIGVTEFYVKKNAKITNTMIHNWTSGVGVRPRAAAIIDENGVFISNYICMEPVKNLQMYPTAYCVGENSIASFQSILYGSGGSKMDVGSRVVLSGKNSRAEIISRAIATDNAEIISRGELVGERRDVKGHLECRGLMLSDDATIRAVPELKAKGKEVELSHEAAIGKIAEEEIRYLMARGLSEEKAASFIIRGFLSLDIKGLPLQLAMQVKRMIKMSAERVL
jgi:hypothetical protein